MAMTQLQSRENWLTLPLNLQEVQLVRDYCKLFIHEHIIQPEYDITLPLNLFLLGLIKFVQINCDALIGPKQMEFDVTLGMYGIRQCKIYTVLFLYQSVDFFITVVVIGVKVRSLQKSVKFWEFICIRFYTDYSISVKSYFVKSS